MGNGPRVTVTSWPENAHWKTKFNGFPFKDESFLKGKTPRTKTVEAKKTSEARPGKNQETGAEEGKGRGEGSLIKTAEPYI